MIVINLDVRALRRLLVGLAAVAAAAWLLLAGQGASAQDGAPPLARYAFVARADNPVDALAASAIAGQLGAPVFLTNTDALGDDARDALVAAAPDTVVLAGGLAALSQAVEDQVAAALPDAQVLRVSGAGRTQTAVALNALAGEIGFNRPVLAGATIAGDVGIDGALTLDGTDVGAAIATLTARVDQLEGLLAGVTRNDDLLTFSGMNLQLVNGEGATATSNGLGNLIVGYSEDHTDTDDHGGYVGDGAADTRGGSHNLVVGVDHSFDSFAGVVLGVDNHVSGAFATVTGGATNTASNVATSITGGAYNQATGFGAAITGGIDNTASGEWAMVASGNHNAASGDYSGVAGGTGNTASGTFATVAGGGGNDASGSSAAVAGGAANTASGAEAVVAGGHYNAANNQLAVVHGGSGNTASGPYAVVVGGRDETEADAYDSWIGDLGDFPDN